MKELTKLAGDMCEFIREKTINEHGFFRTESYNVKTLEWTTDRCDPDDVGDFAPFMVWYDKVTGGQKNIDFVRDQVRMLNSGMMQSSGFYYPFSAKAIGLKKAPIFPSYPQNHVDTLLGLNLLHKLTGEKLYLESARKVSRAIIRYAISGNGFVYGAVIPALHLYYPSYGFLRHKPQVSGIFIEELSIFHSMTGDNEALRAAERMAGAWLSTKTFGKYGLCAEQVYPFVGKEAVRTARIGKENTNFLSGLIRLLEVSEDSDGKLEKGVRKGLDGLRMYLDKKWRFGLLIDTVSGKVTDPRPRIVENHMAMGVLIDGYIVLRDKEYLRAAEKCADAWIGHQSGKGLYPWIAAKSPGWDHCEIDPHLDMVTALCKLYPLSKKARYKRSIRAGAMAARHFVHDGGIYNKIDFKTGKPVDDMNELKFLGGSVKGLMSAHTILNDVKKIDKASLRMLMRDR